MCLQTWMLLLWALSLSDLGLGIVPQDTATVNDSHEEGSIRQNDKYPNPAYPYLPVHGNNIYPDERDRFTHRCSVRLENALEQIRRRQVAKQRTLDLQGFSLHQQLRSAPYDMYVTDMRVRLPSSNSWVRVDKCRFNPRNSSLDTRLLFSDLTISGRVNLFNDLDLQREPISPDPEESCNMILRLRKAGIGFHTEPIRLERGQFNVRTDSHFVEPGFISVYAYGCEPRNQRRRSFRVEDDEELSREMEDIFLKGIRSLLTTYMQKELQPAIKETLMRNMGYTVSYG
ncbi:hypothetical protein NQ315_001052 [Exocentrus adspersus]|uniref:Uncharacterized protein n=1 Tax=Exocentrus adspersus TaxID=1586481 RepID=A0AAV8WDW8_9CUCU|nr:hypothetical protein NQ315_001052 [Exocentrus adspersus]